MKNHFRFYQILGLITVLLSGVVSADVDRSLIDEANKTPTHRIIKKHHRAKKHHRSKNYHKRQPSSNSYQEDNIGYMWIGNFDNGVWNKKILSVSNYLSPSSLEIGNQYTLITGGLNIKEARPENGNPRLVNNKAQLHKGNSIELLEYPEGFKRGTQTHYWAKVKY